MRELALGLLVVTYVLFLALPRVRAAVAVVAGALFVGLGIVPLGAVPAAVDWNVLLMIAGTMGIVALFIESRMPALLADLLIDRMPDVRAAVLALALFAGLISSLVDNVATVLMLAPVALSMAAKLGRSPVAPVICIAISANLQGAATLVGDTTSVLLGGYAGLDFLDFIILDGRPGLFWAVQAGMVASTLVLWMLFRRARDPIHLDLKETVDDYFPTGLLVGMVLLLVLASFIPGRPAITNGLICTGLLGLGLVREALVRRSLAPWRKVMRSLDLHTLIMLTGLFVVIHGITRVGLVAELGEGFVRVAAGNRLRVFLLLVWGSVLLSAFIDNIPYTATMLPVASAIASSLGADPRLFFFGLLIGATLGGNITPFGASANIAGLGILRRHGHHVGTWEFMRYGLPFTLAAVAAGSALVWLVWS